MSSSEAISTPVATPFRRRLAAVWLTYRTRPLAWVTLLAYIAAVVGITVALRESRPPFETWIEMAGKQDTSQLRAQRSSWDMQHRLSATPKSHMPSPQMQFASPELQRAFYQQKPVLPKDARTIVIYSEADIPEEFWDRTKYPRVETVIMFGEPLSSAALEKLITTHRLKALTLNRCEKITAADLQTLSTSESLQFLSLDYCPALTKPDAIPWPRHLRQLTISTFLRLPVERYREWRTLEQLNALVLNLAANDQPTLYEPEIVAELDHFPRRPTLFLDILEGSAGEWAVAAQPHFHRLPVRPKSVPKSRIMAALYALFALILPMGFGTVQLAGQGLQTLVALAPGAVRPHRTFAAAVWIFGGVMTAGLAGVHGVEELAAVALGASGAIIYALLGQFIRQGPGMGEVSWVNPFMAFFPIIFIPATSIFVMLLFNVFPPVAGEVDWFLRGQYPWLAGAAIVGGVLCGWRLLLQMSSIRRVAEEAGLTQVPLSALDVAGWNRAAIPLATRNLDRKVRTNPILRRREQRIETVLNRGPALTRRQRIAVWMCGLPLHPLDFTRVFAVVALVQLGVFFLVGKFGFEVPINRSIVCAVSVQVIAMFLFIPFGVLYSRRRWMEHELLFPLSRQDWIGDWFGAQLWMFAPMFLVLAMIVAIDTALGGVVRPTWQEASIASAVLIYLVVAAWALSLRVATWTGWQSMLFAIAMVGGIFGLAFFFLMLAWMFGDDTAAADAMLKSPWTAVSGIVIAIVALAVLIFSTYRRWQTWEVGRLN